MLPDLENCLGNRPYANFSNPDYSCTSMVVDGVEEQQCGWKISGHEYNEKYLDSAYDASDDAFYRGHGSKETIQNINVQSTGT